MLRVINAAQQFACMWPFLWPSAVPTAAEAAREMNVGMHPVQEDMYSYVTYADDQQTKGKGTSIVES